MFKHNRHRKPSPDELQMSEKRIHFLMERYRRLFGAIIHSRYSHRKDYLNDDDHKFIKFYLDKKEEYKEKRIHITQQEEIDKSIIKEYLSQLRNDKINKILN